jgi:hypothetical protein
MINQEEITMEVAQKIWNIAKISPDHGNALMDLIGEEAYKKVMRLISKNEK